MATWELEKHSVVIQEMELRMFGEGGEEKIEIFFSEIDCLFKEIHEQLLRVSGKL